MEQVIITITDERNGSVFNYPLNPTVSDTLFAAVLESIGYEGTNYQEAFVNWVINTATEVKEAGIRAQKAREAKEEIDSLRESLGL